MIMNIIKKSPAFAAAFYFILTWIGFPIAAFISGHLKGITFAEACARPYLITMFALGSVIAAFQMYNKTKNTMDKQ